MKRSYFIERFKTIFAKFWTLICWCGRYAYPPNYLTLGGRKVSSEVLSSNGLAIGPILASGGWKNHFFPSTCGWWNNYLHLTFFFHSIRSLWMLAHSWHWVPGFRLAWEAWLRSFKLRNMTCASLIILLYEFTGLCDILANALIRATILPSISPQVKVWW